ncbi:LOW QUALITY PROTEIN: hypothetical protein MSG28_001892 [Choristoneura fumiferana]|uniref:Uncharacterized protein n=1 Tax=Choristoneura fumiferana TaxID=7141 RepID=A0ACC0JSZ2_CHOFU|nr:LOW QUALITY PROTEIN: hypothetical protein MSG28_001892 [Choristoneura fumiferana]
MNLRFNSKARKITVIQCYAPTNLASEEDKEDFYRALKLTLKKIRQQNIVIDNDLTIGGTSFIHGDHHKYTWNSPDGVMKNQIDHLAISSKWRSSLLDVRKRLVAEVRLKVALARAASATTKIGKRFEVNKLRDPDVGAAFGLELRNRFSGLEMDSSTSVHAEWNYILLVWNLVESGRSCVIPIFVNCYPENCACDDLRATSRTTPRAKEAPYNFPLACACCLPDVRRIPPNFICYAIGLPKLVRSTSKDQEGKPKLSG